MDISPGTIVGGKYLLERQLERPGARVTRDRGSVWVARDWQLGARVALKLFCPDQVGVAGDLLRIERWLRAAAAIESRHVVRVHDHGVQDGAVYLAMDLLSGEDLAACLHRRGRLPLQEAARVAVHAGEALQRAHAAGLLHQSLRPESVFLAQEGGEEIAKVLDLALPKTVTPRLVCEAAVEASASSLHYLSPEQIRSERTLDAQTDLWSLAAVLFHAVTGHVPFPGDIASVVASKILLAPAPVATQLVPRLPLAVDGFFEKAFARDRARRFRSVEELVESFARVADLAPPPSSGLIRPPPPPARVARAATARSLAAAFARAKAASARPPAPSEPALAAPGVDGRTPPDALLCADRRTPPDTLLSAESSAFPRGSDAPSARGRWVIPAGLLAVLGVATLVTTSRLDRPAPPAMASTGARAAVLSAALVAGGRVGAPPPPPGAAPSAPVRRAPLASPQRSARATVPAPPSAAPGSVQPRPARPAPPAEPAATTGRVRHGLVRD
ncbi:serine/threonine-protein kinase [Sorangium sp. So ce1335]|uniref:serine/threonine-protein kinase n=1 Tax=Sorangium sp. So ce1335 TaxID=3133335 RepID=UPI003F5ED4D2